MTSLGIPLVVFAPDVDESRRPAEPPETYLERVVASKLSNVLASHAAVRLQAAAPGGVLVADTIVVAPDGGLLGKPSDAEDARTMLARLEGATHEVRTRFALAPFDSASNASFGQTVTTRVTFRRLNDEEIDAYVALGEGRDKAGAYAVQGRGAAFVEGIFGSYTNVVGLPLCEVVVAMRTLGWLRAV
jgi:septum formation protein